MAYIRQSVWLTFPSICRWNSFQFIFRWKWKGALPPTKSTTPSWNNGIVKSMAVIFRIIHAILSPVDVVHIRWWIIIIQRDIHYIFLLARYENWTIQVRSPGDSACAWCLCSKRGTLSWKPPLNRGKSIDTINHYLEHIVNYLHSHLCWELIHCERVRRINFTFIPGIAAIPFHLTRPATYL